MKITPNLTPLKLVGSTSSFPVLGTKGEILLAAQNFPHDRIDELCQVSNRSFVEWKQISPTEKSSIFKQFAQNLSLVKEDLVKEHTASGIAPAFAEINLNGSIDYIKHHAKLIQELPSYEQVKGSPNTLVSNEPLGPILSIAPWNAPGILTTRAIMSPLAAGCSVILKSSHLSPQISYLISKCLTSSSGVPDGLLQSINVSSNDSKTMVEGLIRNKFIKGVNFTGSTQTGKQIAKLAGECMKPCVMELGGKNCTIIGNDLTESELTTALTECLISGFFNTGQVCMCTDTIYIPNEKKDHIETLIKQILDKMSTEGIGKELGFYSDLRTKEDHTRVQRIVDRAIGKDGFHTLWRSPDLELCHGPIVLTDGYDTSSVWKNEIFGPIVCLKGYDDIDEAIKEINDLGYGLKCSIWTNWPREKKVSLASKVQCGSVHFNHMTIMDDVEMPHGGVGLSGYGKFNSKWGVESFQYKKLITL